MRFIKTCFKTIFTPVISVGIVVIVLLLLGALQDHFSPSEHGSMVYAGIEEAEEQLEFEVTVPKYFPSYMSWPPAEVSGQLLPFARVETVYRSPYGEKILVVSQTAINDSEPSIDLPWIVETIEEDSITIGEVTGVMISGTDAGGLLLNGAYWKTDDFLYIVVTNRSKNELLSIVRSIR